MARRREDMEDERGGQISSCSHSKFPSVWEFADIDTCVRNHVLKSGGLEFSDIVTRMREECEVDARMRFELGVIDTKLAPLWMSRHGYSVKQENSSGAGGGVQIIDDL